MSKKPSKSLIKNRNWFINILLEKKMTQSSLGRAIGMDRATVSKLFAGNRRLTAADANKMAVALGVPVEDVLVNAGIAVTEMDTGAKIKVIGSVDDNWQVFIGDVRGPKLVPAPFGIGSVKKIKAVRFQTAGSRLGSMDGALAFFSDLSPITLDVLGKLCVAKYGSKNSYIMGVISRGYKSGTFNVQSTSGQSLAEDVALSDASLVQVLKF